MRRFLKTAAVLAPLLAWTALDAPTARADDPAGAQALHDEAKALMKDGKWSAACPKLEESQRLSPAVGTRFKLADCLEHTGRTASAWANFLGVAATAKEKGQKDREIEARTRAAALEPKLSRLAIVVPEASRVAGLDVKRDGESVGAAQWGTPLPVDPGVHEVLASAPGKRAYKAQLEIAGDASTAKVLIPALEDESASAGAVAGVSASGGGGAGGGASTGGSGGASAGSGAGASSGAGDGGESRGGSSSTLGWVLVGAGGVAVAGGAVFWILRGSKVSTLESQCGADNHSCPPTATDDIANGKTYSALGIGLFALGAVSAAAGAGVLIFGGASRKSDAKPTGPSARVLVLPGGVGVAGRF